MSSSLLTICIVTKNCLHDLAATLQSLPPLNHKVNVVAVDGFSTDGTYELLRSHISDYFHLYRESESGIYLAMNIALQHSFGRFIYFLNAGDILCPQNIPFDVLSNAAHSDIILMNSIIDSKYSSGFKFPRSKYFFIRHTLCHQAVFVPASLYRQYGCFDLNYRCRADFDFFLKAFSSASFLIIPHTISLLNSEGFSSKNVNLYHSETKTILIKHLGIHVFFALIIYRTFLKFYRAAFLK